MKLHYPTLPKIRTAVLWTLAVALETALRAAPTIQTIELSPNPLVLGQPATVVVAASPDVTQAIATIDFRPGTARLLRVALSKQGAVWTGTAQVPAALNLPSGAGVTIKALVLDANRKHVEKLLSATVARQITAVFAAGILTVTGDDADNTLVVGRDAAGNLLVNGGAIAISGGAPTVANTTLVRILGLAGNDNLSIDDSAGPMPSASLFGGEGDDTLTGSQGPDELDGGPGNDTLLGRGGADRLFGGPGDDILTGGRDADQVFGGDGNDQIIWNPGDGSDFVEGENGDDTLLFAGANIGENVELSADGNRLRFVRNIAGITIDCGGVERVIFRALGGPDNVTINDLDATDVTEVVVDLATTSGPADDQPDVVIVNGSDASEIITVTDSAGAVEIRGLAALVRIIGSEPAQDQLILKGNGGADLVDLIGSDEDEQVSFSADSARLLFSNNRASIRVACESMQQVNFRAFGGSDQVFVDDLTGTGVARIGVDLSGPTIGIGDGQPDTVVINGTPGDDTITLDEGVIGITVDGLSARVIIVGGESGADELVIDALAGADVINASLIEPGEIDLTLRGGADRDLLIGGQGNDLLIGGRGDDVLSGGPGDDTFPWNPGDGSDVIEGNAGDDTLVFNGANIGEEFVLAPLGPHLRLSRNVAAVAMDCSSVERVELNALGGSDRITIQDLSPTTVRSINLNLGSAAGSADNAPDSVVLTGTAGADNVHITGSAGLVHVQGLSADVNISGADPALDQLLVSLLEGDDVAEATGLQAGLIILSIQGGPGDDVLIGSPGPDTLFGGDGDDVLEGGPGFDVLDGGPGSNILIQD